jgi:hypothetical protein
MGALMSIVSLHSIQEEKACRGIGVVQVHELVIGGGWVPVVHQGEVETHPRAEALQIEDPVEPPARALLAKHDHQQGSEEQQSTSRCAQKRAER